MAANHLSNFDPPLLGIISPNRLYYLGKQELFCNNFVSWFLDSYGVIPLRRQASDINAIRRAIEVLKQGKPLVIFPQGSRSENYDVFFGGVGFLHRKTKVPVVLAKLEGTDKIFSKKEKKLGINSKIRVKFKKMQDFPEERNNKDIAKKIIGGIRGL
jgi:1-acyl-sn-glycerol-3-phosphate acyltransferase